MAGVAIFVRKSILHLDNFNYPNARRGITRTYSLLVIISCELELIL